MRIVLVGQAAFGAQATRALLGNGDEVVAIFTTPDAEKSLPLKKAAESYNIPLYQPEGMRGAEVSETIERMDADLGIMAFVTDFVPVGILRLPRYGTIQYHPSLLPRHRGRSGINWAILRGEKETGVTIFWPDEGLDTGPILLQKRLEIRPDDTVGSLYFERLFPLGIDAIMEAVGLVNAGKAPRIPQDDLLATYEPPCAEKHVLIRWERPVLETYRTIRGGNPQPGATTFLKGSKVKVYEASVSTDRVRGNPGEIVSINRDGLRVAGRDGAILIKRVQPEGHPKMPASDYVLMAGVSIGDTFG